MKHLFFLLPATLLFCQNTRAQLQPEYQVNETGITWRLPLPAEMDSDQTAQVLVTYETGWGMMPAFESTRLKAPGLNEFRGAIFPTYFFNPIRVKMVYLDSFPVLDSSVWIDTIKPSKNIQAVYGNTYYVSPTGSGIAYTQTQPGKLETLVTNPIGCGTRVLLMPGTYDVANLNVTINGACSDSNPVTFATFVPGKATLDGGYYPTVNWTQDATDTTLWYATMPIAQTEFSSLVTLDGHRLYPYPFLSKNALLPNYPHLKNLGYDQDGFYRSGNVFYIKTKAGKNPNKVAVVISKALYCINVTGNGTSPAVQFDGLSFKHYGNGTCQKNGFGIITNCYTGHTLQFTDCKATVRACNFTFSNFPVSLTGKAHNSVLINNYVKDETGLWSHGAFKQTADILITEPGSYGRYTENVGLRVVQAEGDTIKNVQITDNTIDGVISGISTGSFATAFATENADINGNRITNCYDGIDALNNNLNVRIHHNTISYCPVGISLILPSYGPTYIYRNLIHHISQRKNHNNDIFFADCTNRVTDQIWGTGLKLNASGNNTRLPGQVFVVHNTFHSSDTLGFSAYLWNATWRRLVFRNNIFSGISPLGNFFLDGVKDDSGYSLDSKGDFWHNPTGNLATVQAVNGQLPCSTYQSLTSLQAGLSSITQSPLVTFQGKTGDPKFLSDFSINTNSGASGSGIEVPGFYDYLYVWGGGWGFMPDAGYYQYGPTGILQPTETTKSLHIYPNPAGACAWLQTAETMQQATLSIVDLAGRVVYQKPVTMLGNMPLQVETAFLPQGMYVVQVSNGSGIHIGKLLRE